MASLRPVLVLVMDGIGTAGTPSRTSGVLDRAVDVVMSSGLDVTRELVVWPASYGPVGNGMSWSMSADIGVVEADRILQNYPEHDIVIFAYSGGNLIAKRLLEIRPDLYHRVVAMGRLSDPWRPHQRWQNGTPDPGGWGVCGEDLGPIPDRTYWTSSPSISRWLNPPNRRNGRIIPHHVLADPISSASARSLLRPFADGTDYLGTDPDAFFADLRNISNKNNAQIMLELVKIRQNPLGYLLSLGDRAGVAFQETLAYMLYSQHTYAYIEPFRTTDGDMSSLSVRLGKTVLHKTMKRAMR